jgi:hypothetical protein
MRKCSPLFVEGWYVWETLALEELGYLLVIETELLSGQWMNLWGHNSPLGSHTLHPRQKGWIDPYLFIS